MEDPRIISALFIFLKMAYYNVLINNQPAERTTFMEVQAEPDMIGNYIEMYHLAPAKYMDKKHWLAVPLDGSVSDSKVLDLLDMSYDLVDGQAETDGETGADR